MKVTCKVCGHQAHDLRPHFNGACEVTLEEYQARFPMAALTSELFDRKLSEIRSKAMEDGQGLTLKKYSIKAVFGIDMGKHDEILGFVERSKHVPDIDPEYQFPAEATKIALLGLITNRPTLVHGPTGSGKSTLIEQIAARINYPALRVNHHADMYTYDIVGQKKIKNGETAFEYGPLPQAMRRPIIMILDEWDALNPEIALQYQSVLEKKHTGTLGNCILTANEGEIIQSHPLFRIMATSNTCGLGDEKGHYQGTQVQNLAFVSRFLLRVRLDYLDQTHESALLQKKFPELDKTESGLFAKTAKLIRERYEAGELNVPFSIRDLLNWVSVYLMIGNPGKAIKYTCTSILPFADAKIVEEIIQRTLGATS